MVDKRLEVSDHGLFSYTTKMEDLLAHKAFNPDVDDGRGNKISGDFNMSWKRGCVGPRCRLHGGRRYAFQADPVMAVTR